LKPSLLELKIKKKPTKPKPTMPHPEVIAMGIERKKNLNLNLRGPGFDPLPRKNPI